MKTYLCCFIENAILCDYKTETDGWYLPCQYKRRKNVCFKIRNYPLDTRVAKDNIARCPDQIFSHFPTAVLLAGVV